MNSDNLVGGRQRRKVKGGVSSVIRLLVLGFKYYHYREMAIIMLNHCATARQDDVSHKNGLVLIFLVETRLKLKKRLSYDGCK